MNNHEATYMTKVNEVESQCWQLHHHHVGWNTSSSTCWRQDVWESFVGELYRDHRLSVWPGQKVLYCLSSWSALIHTFLASENNLTFFTLLISVLCQTFNIRVDLNRGCSPPKSCGLSRSRFSMKHVQVILCSLMPTELKQNKCCYVWGMASQ